MPRITASPSVVRPTGFNPRRAALLLLALAALGIAGVLTAASRWQTHAAAPPASLHLQVPDDFTIERVAGPDLLDYPMFATLAGEGRLLVCESTGPNTMTTDDMLASPSYHVRLLEDTDGDGAYDRSRIFAASDEVRTPSARPSCGMARTSQGAFVSASPAQLERWSSTIPAQGRR